MIQKAMIDEALVISRIKAAPTVKGIFKLPIGQAFCQEALSHALVKSVNDVNIEFISHPKHDAVLESVSNWLVGHSYKNGLWLCGLGGTGKTTLVSAIQKLVNSLSILDPILGSPSHLVYAGLVVVSARKLCHLYVNEYATFQRYQRTALLAIDDLGAEAEKTRCYGQECDPIGVMLGFRYENRLFTIVTTNLPSDQIRGRYGDRTADRVRQMMHVVPMPEKNFREDSKTFKFN